MIKLVDTAGDTVLMTEREIADRLKRMGNPAGEYLFVKDTPANQTLGEGHAVAIQVLDEKPDDVGPRYTWFSRLKRLFRKAKVPTWARLKDGKTVRIIVS